MNRTSAPDPSSPASRLTAEDRTMLGEIAAVMLHPTLPPQATMRLQLSYGRDQTPPLVEHFNAGEYLGRPRDRHRRRIGAVLLVADLVFIAVRIRRSERRPQR